MKPVRRIAAAAGALVLLCAVCSCSGSGKPANHRGRADGAAVAVRTLPAGYSPGASVTVTIALQPPAGTAGIALEESVPAGWNYASSDNGGTWDSVNRRVKWVFFDDTARTLHYTLTVPAGASGDQVFSGLYAIEGQSQAIGGDTVLQPSGGQTHQADANGDGKIVIDELTAYIQAWKQGQYDDINLVTNAISLWKGGESYHYDGTASPPYVGNGGGGGNTKPTLTSMAPASGTQGASVAVTLTGMAFVAGATVSVSGSGITVSNVVVASATSITAKFDISASAATGARDVSVTTSGGTSGTVSFTIVAGRVLSLTSVSGAAGANVTLKCLLSDVTDVKAAVVRLTWDTSKLALVGGSVVKGADVSSGANFTVTTSTPGQATVVIADSTAFTNTAGGHLFSLDLTIVSPSAAGATNPVTIYQGQDNLGNDLPYLTGTDNSTVYSVANGKLGVVSGVVTTS